MMKLTYKKRYLKNPKIKKEIINNFLEQLRINNHKKQFKKIKKSELNLFKLLNKLIFVYKSITL